MKKNSPRLAEKPKGVAPEGNVQRKIILQKGRPIQGEFHGWNEQTQSADFNTFLGSVNMRDEMTLVQYIEQLETLTKALKKQKGSVFVVQ